MTDRELAEAAWAEFQKTTDPYPTWARKGFPLATHWAKGYDFLSRIGATPPPPPTPSFRWGANIANAIQLVTPGGRLGELQRAKDAGCTFMRVDGEYAEADRIQSLWGPDAEWVAILGASKNFATVAQTIAYLDRYPGAWISPGNELNLGSSWTPSQLAAQAKAWYPAVKAKHPNSTLLLPCLGNSESRYNNYTPIQFGTEMAANGCLPAVAFDKADYHVYEGNNPNWYHWRDDATGHSVQSAFGHPEYIISEFGARSANGDYAGQAALIDFHMKWIKQDPKCVGAQVYATGDDAEGEPNESAPYDWGLYRLDGTPKPSRDVFRSNAR